MPNRKWICLVGGIYAAALILPAIAGAAVPDPDVLWWKFDEGTGTVAKDSSGKGHDGTITGATWKTGGVGGTGSCLDFPGSLAVSVEDKNAPSYLNGLGAITVSLWIKSRVTNSDNGFIIGENPAGNDSFVTMRYDAAGASFGGTSILKMAVTSTPGGEQQLEAASGLQTTNWQHVVMTWKGGELLHFYADGKAITPTGQGAANAGTISGCTTLIVGKGGKDLSGNPGTGWNGLIDDVRIYSTVLTAAQIAELAVNKPMLLKASTPTPTDGAVGVGTPLLQWVKGDTAVFHNVYLGTTPELTEANVVAKNQPFALYFHVPGLQPGATYYWRVDEIEADMTTIRTGDVWTFVAQALTAYHPSPVNEAGNVSPGLTLTWSPGLSTLKHHLYLSDDLDAVKQGTASADKGELTDTTYTPTDLQGGTTYYWRVDELIAGGTVKTGEVWSFTTFMLVDDMESYTDDEGGRIYETWIDGWTNGTGSTVGNTIAPFAERTIIHGGKQSMPMDFNNTKTPFYSEAELDFAPVQNWTATGATDLSLWIRGNPIRFVDKGNEAFTVGASGHDIWDNADDFRFIYKKLSGNGSIAVKVESLVNTNVWAKAGVMIRDSLDAGSQMAYMIQSFSSGASFGWRQTAGSTCGSGTQTGITAPQWVKLIRTGNAFTAQYSADGKTWKDIMDTTTNKPVSTNVTMGASVYLGLCVTSHDTALTTTAELSEATTTGGVTGSWQPVWIGDDPDRTNGSANLYVAVEDSAGKVAVASDPALVNAAAWTEWKIPLSSFTGVNLAKVKALYIGVGDRKNPVADGAGRIYIDDIRVIK